ncbi:MAG: ATP phosphoribosyltransferase [Actinomycetes bacterium]|jgi:ATP phosphoribosyltransferase regulatory subunit|nr:ATP phosphoribosyltransferase [Actinomycetes bacterium]
MSLDLRRPRGFRDLLPAEAQAREALLARINACFETGGYGLIETPSIEYFDALDAAGSAHRDDAFRFVDVDGRLLALRTDVTIPLARVVATRFRGLDAPFRLRYSAEVFREQESLRGNDRQFTQIGIECIGPDAETADLEILQLAAAGLDAAGLDDYCIHLSNSTVMRRLIAVALAGATDGDSVDALAADDADDADAAYAAWRAGDLIRLTELVAAAPAAGRGAASALRALIDTQGDLSLADRLVDAVDDLDGQARRAMEGFAATCHGLIDAGLDRHFRIDFSVAPDFDYYTGLVFEIYAPAAGELLGSGGRYDTLLASLGRDLPAAGFVYAVPRLQRAMSAGNAAQRDVLRIAVPKGKLFGDTVELLDAAGLDTRGLAEAGRRLQVQADGVEYTIAKPSDVAIYVSRGAVDCGIGGRDILVEADFPLLQLADLGFGACEFVVAARDTDTATLDEMSLALGTVRVATKYPRLAQAHFDARGIQAEIVKLNGNIELAPLIGIADVIVDITQTGTTLRENKLRIVEHLLPSTARFVANTVSARRDGRVMELARAFRRLTGVTHATQTTAHTTDSTKGE